MVVRGELDVEQLRPLFERAPFERAEVAVCHVLEVGRDSICDALSSQRAITSALRAVLGPRAEAVAVFVASERDGDTVEDCAREWGATVVLPSV